MRYAVVYEVCGFSVSASSSAKSLLVFFSTEYVQRKQQRRNYDDEAIGDDEIEGKRTFNVDEKLQSTKFEEETFVKSMKGTGGLLEDHKTTGWCELQLIQVFDS